MEAREPSDPYLMTGYERKVLYLSHKETDDVILHVQVDIEGTGHWKTYKSFTVPCGSTVQYVFPDAFSAYWVRAVSSKNAVATVQLSYE